MWSRQLALPYVKSLWTPAPAHPCQSAGQAGRGQDSLKRTHLTSALHVAPVPGFSIAPSVPSDWQAGPNKVVCARAGAGGKSKGLATTLAVTLQRVTEDKSELEKEKSDLMKRLSEAEKQVVKLECKLQIEDIQMRYIMNAYLAMIGKRDLRSILEVACALILEMYKASPLLKGVRGAGRFISALLDDKADTFGLNKRIASVAQQANLRRQDINDILRNIYNQLSSEFHGTEGAYTVLCDKYPPFQNRNTRAAVAIFLDWAKVPYVYMEKNEVIRSPFKLPLDPPYEHEFGLSAEELQAHVGTDHERLSSN